MNGRRRSFLIRKDRWAKVAEAKAATQDRQELAKETDDKTVTIEEKFRDDEFLHNTIIT